MAYVALRPCNFAGQAFRIGDTIPADLVQPGIAKSLIAMGRIAAAEGTATEPKQAEPEAIHMEAPIGITLKTKDGPLLTVHTASGLQSVFDVLTGTVKEAEATINGITDEDALILIHATDSRKSVKELAANRAAELNPEAEGGDQ